MARVTVEDCILNIPNRFELVIIAAQRAKQIASGTPLTVERDNDKDAVVSLREIADKTIDLEALKEELIQNNCKRATIERIERQAMKFQQETGSREQVEKQISDAFEDAKHHVAVKPSEDDDDDLEADKAGPSFADENIEVED